MQTNSFTPQRPYARITMILAVLIALVASLRPTLSHAQSGWALINGTIMVINNESGDQRDAHVSGDLVTYYSVVVGNSYVRYYNFLTGTDASIPQEEITSDFLPAIDGTKIVYTHVTSTSYEINFFDTTGGSPVTLDPHPYSLREKPAIGGQTVVWVDYGYNDDLFLSEIVVYDLASGIATRLTNDSYYDADPNISPDGSFIVWTKCQVYLTDCHTWQAAYNGNDWVVAPLAGSGNQLHPATDGQYIVYYGDINNNIQDRNIFWQLRDSNEEHELALPGTQRNPSIDGGMVVFENFDTNAAIPNWDLMLYDLNNDRGFRVTDTNASEVLPDIAVAPDGLIHVVWQQSGAATDADIYASTFRLPDSASTPDIAVIEEQTGAVITDGDTIPSIENGTDFGRADVNGGASLRTFNICNVGSDPLGLLGARLVDIIGSSDFQVIEYPESVLGISECTSFTVVFHPTSGGVQTATISIVNNDLDESPFDFAIQGTGIPWVAPTDITLSNTSISENLPAETLVGTFSTTDENIIDSFLYSFCTPQDSIDFSILGDALYTSYMIDYESHMSGFTFCLRSTDAHGLSYEKNFHIDVLDVDETNGNIGPMDITLSNTSINENQPVGTVIGTLDTVDVNEGDTHTYILTSCSWNDGTWAFFLDGSTLKAGTLFDYETQNSYNICITATDSGGASLTKGFTITVIKVNQPPVIDQITAPLDPMMVNATVPVTASFSDPDIADIHTAVWDWGDGNTASGLVSEASGTGTVNGSHAYANAGVYVVTLTITDNHDAVDTEIFQYVVVYNPTGGFVTGSGWIDSPAGAYTPNPEVTGKAHFGFVSRYQKGATLPSGSTEFQFKAGGLSFRSTAYDWLVIAGAKAQFKGVGTINGSGDYGFLLTVTDGQVSGGGGVDKFRIKIWDRSSGAVVYDNQIGADETSDPVMTIGGGSIVIHK